MGARQREEGMGVSWQKETREGWDFGLQQGLNLSAFGSLRPVLSSL